MKQLDRSDKVLIGAEYSMEEEDRIEKSLLTVRKPEILQNYYKKLQNKNIDIILTNTEAATRTYLEEQDIKEDFREINKKAVEIIKEVSESEMRIAGNIGSAALEISPFGSTTFEKSIEIYKEQIQVLAQAGIDIIYLNSFSEIQNLRAAIIAANSIEHNLPIFSTADFSTEEMKRGTDIQTFTTIINSLGTDAIGINNTKLFRKLEKYTNLPLIANIDNKNQIEKNVKSLNRRRLDFVLMTDDTDLKDIGKITELREKKRQQPENDLSFAVTNDTTTINIGSESPFIKIGERINPTGRDEFAEELKQGNIDQVLKDAEDQIQAGADLLDVNLGASMVDEKELMKKSVKQLQKKFDIPLVIDSSDPEVIEAGLKNYAGKALVNSVDADEEKQEKVLPLVKKYGAGLIALTIKDGKAGEPKRRLSIARSIVKKCKEYNIPKSDIIVDTAAMSAATSPEAGRNSFETVKKVKEELDLPTMMGISNTSFGLPQRKWVHNTFLAQAMSYGLDAGIVNVNDPELEKVIMTASIFAGRDEHCMNYIKYVRSLDKD